MNLSTILDQIDLGSMALPEFQRGYVWNRDQVRALMDSLYRKHPVGSLLVWATKTETASVRGDGQMTAGSVKLLLDGQQRITSLYGIIRGKPPRFFDGNAQAFTGLYFNLDEEQFEFYGPLKMKDNPLWINVTELMQIGVGEFINRIYENADLRAKMQIYINRLNAIDSIKAISLHIEEVTGDDKTVDIVVDIFNRVNSGGTKLSKGDLALAKVCAEWPDARDEMKIRLDKWKQAGFNFRLEWLLRCINTIITGEALFSFLKDVDTPTFKKGLEDAEYAIDSLLNLISGRLGLDHDDVLGSRYSFPLMARYLQQRNWHLTDYRERDRLIYWYVHTFLWGRYAGSTESVMNQDLHLIENIDEGLDKLVEQLRRERGDLKLYSRDFEGWSRSARFYPLLYMLTRVWHAKDFASGLELSNNLLGKLNRLQVHHIFPKALLYKHGYDRPSVNAIANFTFLTQDTNLQISDADPADYLEYYTQQQPGAVESHWIPMDRNLWRVENYHEFLAARRESLAKAANDFMGALLYGPTPQSAVVTPVMEGAPIVIPGSIDSDEEELALRQINAWVVEQGLPEGELMYEISDPSTGESLAMLDLAWPEGLQEGLSQPAALLIGESEATYTAINRAGYRYFTDADSFRDYVLREILAVQEDTAG